MHSDAQLFRDDLSTSTARLRGVSGINGHHLTTGTFSLVVEQLSKHPQPCVVCRQSEVPIARHKRKGKVFNGNPSVGICQLAGHLVPEISPLILDPFVDPRHLKHSLSSAVTSLRASSHAPLGHAQFFQPLTQPAGIVIEGAIREGEQTLQPHINANGRASMWHRLQGWNFHKKGDIPVTRRTALEGDLAQLGPIGQGGDAV